MTDRPSAPQKLAENATLTIIARLAMICMPFVTGALVWFASNWIDERFSSQEKSVDSVRVQIEAVKDQIDDLPDLRQRIAIYETLQANSKYERERFQEQMVSQMNKMQDAIITLSNTVSGLTATIREQSKEGN